MEQEFEERAKNYVLASKQHNTKIFKFDCTQLSPAVRAALGNRGIPVAKKALSISSFQTNDFLSSDVN